MQTRRFNAAGKEGSRGAALLLSLLILIVLVAIVLQINLSTGTDARIARNDVGLGTMDLAIESALLQVDEQLKTDAESDSAGSGATPPGGGAAPAPGGAAPPAGTGAAPGAGGGQQGPVDSRRDEWARPARTEINDIRLRILIQDEDSKINVLSMLHPDEREAQAAFDRVVRCLDLCREGTDFDIDTHTAEQMARAMLEHMKSRRSSRLPRPALLSDDPSSEDLGLPLSMREFAVIPPFEESHFRDFRDAEGRVVHSIGSFLTVWSSVATAGDLPAIRQQLAKAAALAANPTPSANGGSSGGSGGHSGSNGSAAATPGSAGASPTATTAGGAHVDTGGWAVNVNTAPVAVLKSLFDDHDLHPRFWDRVVEYRNQEEEKSTDAPVTDAPPVLDEYGNEIVEHKIFESLSELKDVEGWVDLSAEMQGKLNQVLTTQSRVFSIFVVARRSTSAEADMDFGAGQPEEVRDREERGDSLVRVVRCVVWRREVDDKMEVVPLVRWEVLDYAPFEVQDYPDENR